MEDTVLAAIIESRAIEARERAEQPVNPRGDRMRAELEMAERMAEFARYEAYKRCADMLRGMK